MKKPIVNKEKPPCTEYLFKEVCSSMSSSESSKVTVVIDVKKPRTYVRVEKTISETFEIQDYDKAIDLYERLNCGSGRKCWTLEEMAHPYNPNK